MCSFLPLFRRSGPMCSMYPRRWSSSTCPPQPSDRGSASPYSDLLSVHRDWRTPLAVEEGLDRPCLQKRKTCWSSELSSCVTYIHSLQNTWTYCLLTHQGPRRHPQHPGWGTPRLQEEPLHRDPAHLDNVRYVETTWRRIAVGCYHSRLLKGVWYSAP